MTQDIRGAGFFDWLFGKPPKEPVIEPDSLDSRQFATIQDLLSEGEIEGFPSAKAYTRDTDPYNTAALKDIYLNKTPILDANADATNPQDSDYNFRNVQFNPRYGTSNQEYIRGITDSVADPTNIGVEVTEEGGGVTRQISAGTGGAPDPDAVRITLTWPAITKGDKKGNQTGDGVVLKIQSKYNGETSFTTEIDDTVSGRTTDAYQKDYRINIDQTKNGGNAFPVDIKVVRVTGDSPSTLIINAFYWSSLTTIVDDKQRYLNSAYCSLRLDSKQFSNIPTRQFRIRGVKVRLPNNASVDSNTGRVTYSGAWNGTFGAAQWCSCPSWILYDLLCAERYGFGDQILTDTEKSSFNGSASRLDKFSFYAASVYCNELVDDGFNGEEARFSCNVSIQTPTEAFDLINELSGVMRCMPFWGAGSVTISQDGPTATSYLFNLSNVSPEGFSYSGTSLKTRHTVFVVSYFNMDTIDIDYETYEDTANVAKWGQIVKQVKAFACTSRGQAIRLGKYLAFTEHRESEVITFMTSMESGAVVRPGMVIDVTDPVRSGLRRGGRISAASTTVITVDDEDSTDLTDTDNPKLRVVLPDGLTERQDVASISGTAITVASAYSQAPAVGSIWLLENDTVKAEQWRVLSVTEKDQGQNYVITASPYIEGKYENIDEGTPLTPRRVSILDQPATPPQNLKAQEQMLVINGKAVTRLTVSWKPSIGVVQYQFKYRYEKGPWFSQTVPNSSFEIMNSQVGTYDFKVAAFSFDLNPSTLTADLEYIASGKDEPPADVSNLSFEGINANSARLTWDKATDLDVIHGGRIFIRHSSLTNGSGSWSNSTDLISSLPGNSTQAVVPLLTGEYIVKFEDDTGHFSTGEASIIVSAPAVDELLVGLTQREDTGNFAGNKVNTIYDASLDALKLINPSASGTGTYSQSGTTVTISITSHGVVVGETLTFTYSSGNATDGDFTVVSVADANTFTVTAANSITTSGNVSVVAALTGTYEFQNVLDLGAIFNVDLERVFATRGLYPSALIDDKTALIDTWTDFDGDTPDKVNAVLQVATSEDASSYGSYAPFANGTFRGRAFKFKTILSTTDAAQNILVDQLGFKLKFTRRTEQSIAAINSTTSGKTIAFTKSFFTGTSVVGGSTTTYLPSIGITAYNMGSGDYFAVSNVTGAEFTVIFKDSSNNPIAREFSYTAVGFGRSG